MFRCSRLGRRLATRQASCKASGLAISDIFAWGRSGFTKLRCLRHHYTNKRVDRERTMEFRFFYPSCGQKLKAEEEHAGRRVDCPHRGFEIRFPQPEPELPSAETID
jgi:hypothetical protein